MGWTNPRTWVTGEVVTAAQMNAHVRDNEIDLDARTSKSSALVSASETTTSTTYTDLTTSGPTVTLNTGTKVVVAIRCNLVNNGAGQYSLASIAVSGATTIAASDGDSVYLKAAVANGEMGASSIVVFDNLTPGSNTFTMKYRVTAGTGTFGQRRITVWPGNKLT